MYNNYIQTDCFQKIYSRLYHILIVKEFTIENAVRGPKIKIRKSIFIASLFPISTDTDINNKINTMKAEFSKASHSAYAFIIKKSGKIRSDYYDDGEVKGTAGRVILQNMDRAHIVNL